MEKKETNDTADVKAICPRCDTETCPTDTCCEICRKKIPTDFEGMLAALLLGYEIPPVFGFKKGAIITDEITKILCAEKEKKIYMAYQKISKTDATLPLPGHCNKLTCPGKPLKGGGRMIGKTLTWPPLDRAPKIVFCEVCKWGIDTATVVETDESKMSLRQIFEHRQTPLMLGAKVALDIFSGNDIVIKKGGVVTNELIAFAKEQGLFTKLSMSLKYDE